MTLTSVRFKRRYRMYNPGERAGFEPEEAKRLVRTGVADYAKQAEPEAEGTRRASSYEDRQSRPRREK